jgi:hypothetical protein
LAHEKDSSLSVQKPPLLLGLLGILSFVFGAWFFSKLHAPNDDSGESICREDTPKQKSDGSQSFSTSTGPFTIHSPTDPSRAEDSSGHKTPWWEKAAVFVALGLLVVNTFQMCATKKSADAATKAANTAQAQLEMSERPWVSLDDFTVDSPLTFDNAGAHVTIRYEIKNTGRSPAIRGFWQPDFFLQFGENPSPVRKRDDACKIAAFRSTKVTDSRITETWFPGEGLPQGITESVGLDDIAKALEIPKQMFPTSEHIKDFDYIYPDFVICIAYRAAFTDTQYQTGYILELRRTNPKIPYIPPMKKGEIPARELKLYVHPFYGIYAD